MIKIIENYIEKVLELFLLKTKLRLYNVLIVNTYIIFLFIILWLYWYFVLIFWIFYERNKNSNL